MSVKNVVFLFRVASDSLVETSIAGLIGTLEGKRPPSKLLTNLLDSHEWFHNRDSAAAGGRVFLEVSGVDDAAALEREVQEAIINMGGTDARVYVENVDMHAEYVARARASLAEKRRKYLALVNQVS